MIINRGDVPSAIRAGAMALGLALCTYPAHARITRIVIDTATSPAFGGQSFGTAGQYETLSGRAFGELDPADPHNAIIQDISLAPRNANSRVEYMATFFVVKPIDMSRSSHVLWEDVPNRGGRITIGTFDRNNGDIGLSAGWQGDNVGGTQQVFPNTTRDFVVVPVAKNPDGSAITGMSLGRIYNVSGPASQAPLIYTNPTPYPAATLDTSKAQLITRTHESMTGEVTGEQVVPSSDWAWARCSATNPFPGTPDATQVCLRNGFDPGLIYTVVFPVKDPYVLGIGFAAFRDLGSFFKYATSDDVGTPNPLAGGVVASIARGSSQSGNFLREYIQLGFTQDEAGRKVHDASWPTIAGRRLIMNVRFATPDAVLHLYQAGSEGPMWWTHWPDTARALPAAGILDRCTANNSCPKIVETFGAAEFWDLHMSPNLVGTGADQDIPLTRNIRRYYIPSTPHGGGSGGFTTTPAAIPSGSGTNWGQCTFAANPVPHTETRNALTVGLRKWVLNNVPMVPSRYPTLIGGNLVAPTKEAMGFPTIPGLPADAPSGLINPLFDYDFGPRFNVMDVTGIVDNVPPVIRRILPSVVPRVDGDGNELGGVPVVLRDAPLGTYMGWNITAAGVFKGNVCSFTGGMIPFATTREERLATGDPRLSLQERYGTHDGYVQAVRNAATNAVAQGFLLQSDADAMISAAQASNVLQ